LLSKTGRTGKNFTQGEAVAGGFPVLLTGHKTGRQANHRVARQESAGGFLYKIRKNGIRENVIMMVLSLGIISDEESRI
jgi:hypothetical protein